MTDPDLLDADPEELAEAERLAAALDGRSVKDAPGEALEAAALLRAIAGAELPQVKADAILEQVLREARPPAASKQRSFRAWVWSACGVAAAVVLGVVSLERKESPVANTELPPPSIELIEAQALRLRGEGSGEYREELAAYRGRVFAALRSEGGTK